MLSRYSAVYICVTFIVLLVLNFYCSDTSQLLFFQSKESAMFEKCQVAAAEVSTLDLLNAAGIAQTLQQLDGLNATRTIVTDRSGIALYDSYTVNSCQGMYVLLPEVVHALSGTKSFSSEFDHDKGVIQSRVATPIYTSGVLAGCVYMMEYDAEQGALMHSLQKNILTISLVLVVAVILFSIVFSNGFSARLRRVLSSMRIIRSGDYSHRVIMGGNDELTFLGDEFNLLTERLQISEEKRRRFVSDASHELKTPLASIKLLTDSILQNDMDTDTIREFVTDIGNEADRLNRMTQKLLSLSKVDSQQDGDCEIVYMKPTIEKAVRMLSGIADNNDIHIYTDFSDDCPILILEDDLYQIAFNLTENGIKYNRPGGSLFLRTYRQADNAVLEVRDTGVGIPESAQAHIFERFYRVDKARSRSTGGSGLGLAIVRSMVERNQGTIHVESQENIGSTFRVCFPAFDPQEVNL